ncbi:MAG: hypothetical protein WCI52_03730 [bacterium]
MSNIIQKIKIPVIILAVIIALFFGYSYLTKDGGSTTGLVSDSSVIPSTSQADQDFLKLLLKIQNVRIDPSIFSNPVFLSLQDDGLPILDQPEGRPNPFAPIGTDSGMVSTATSSKN